MADECGFKRISLGKRILRTETAGLMILSVIGFKIELENNNGSIL
jgi:16S rRNA U1498 N3-methylase RsmE